MNLNRGRNILRRDLKGEMMLPKYDDSLSCVFRTGTTTKKKNQKTWLEMKKQHPVLNAKDLTPEVTRRFKKLFKKSLSQGQ
jgi:hypothetical protein